MQESEGKVAEDPVYYKAGGKSVVVQFDINKKISTEINHPNGSPSDKFVRFV
jgi:hypothetical protein